jgi:hypothetical protein
LLDRFPPTGAPVVRGHGAVSDAQLCALLIVDV